LVFRPYAHLPPSSCTSERLEASTELSSSFSSDRHSSLSFGSHSCIPSLSANNATMVSLVRVTRRVKTCFLRHLHFHFAPCPFHTSIALLLRYRSSHIFSLGSPQPPTFTLHYQTVLLSRLARPPYGNLSPSVPASHGVQYAGHYTTRLARRRTPITTRAPLLSLAATQKILVSFFSSP